jgi:hypothetical protein
MSEAVSVELTPREREVLVRGLVERTGPARMTEPLARALWFDGLSDFEANLERLRNAIEAGDALPALDWHRALSATEVVFASWVLGAGGDWSIVTGLGDEETLRELRSIQRKLPWCDRGRSRMADRPASLT